MSGLRSGVADSTIVGEKHHTIRITTLCEQEDHTAKIAPLLNRFFEKSVHFKNNLCFLFFNDVGRLPIVASFFAF